MISRFRISTVLALALVFGLVLPVFAGGWAVITLDELPAGVAAGEPFTVGFTVLQHGRTPMTDLNPVIVARSGDERVTVVVEAQGEPGHYATEMILPSEGQWEWTIQAFTMEQKMPVLTVAAPSVLPVGRPEAKAGAFLSPVNIVRVISIIVGLVGLAFALRKRSRIAIALSALCFTVGVGSWMVGPAVPGAEAEFASPSKFASDESFSQVELGERLFVAKGCITCHVNARVANAYEYWTINLEGATNLTNFSASPEVLRIRLKDPTAAKSDTQMPNLGLSDVEIEALIAFINSK